MLREFASPLISRVSPRREDDLVGGLRDRHRLGEAGVGAAALRVGVGHLRIGELAALRIGRCGGALRGDAVEDGDHVPVVAAAPPRPEQVVLVLRQRPDHRRPLRGIERQHAALVLQQHHRARRGAARGCNRVRPQHLCLGLLWQVGRVRVLEQTRAHLDTQDPAHCIVDPAHRDLALRKQLLAEVADHRARHLRVDSSVQRERRRLGPIRRDTMAALAGSGFLGGQARISDTAVQSLSTKPSKPHSPLRMSLSR